MQHIVLLGDSIFDNGVYVNGAADVASHLRQLSPADWKVTLRAVDGSRTADVLQQIRHLPESATQLFLSVGGNDALAHAHLLSDTTTCRIQILEQLAAAVDDFGSKYRKTMQELTGIPLPLAVFTIYNGNLEPTFAKAVRAADAVFNDSIYRIAGEYSVPVLELRRICSEPSDYANPIEPSSSGGRKIAEAMLRFVGEQHRVL